MSDEGGTFQNFTGRDKALTVEIASVYLSEKYKIVFVSSEKIRFFFTVDKITFICFRFACIEFTAMNKIKCSFADII